GRRVGGGNADFAATRPRRSREDLRVRSERYPNLQLARRLDPTPEPSSLSGNRSGRRLPGSDQLRVQLRRDRRAGRRTEGCGVPEGPGGSMRPLVITPDVATRITRGLTRASMSRIGPVGRVEGDPLGVEIRRWGDVVGTLVMRPVWYYRYFNVLKNVGRDDEVAVDEALAWYRGHDARCRVTVSPFESSEGILAGLSRRGLRPVQFMSVLCRTLDGTEAAPSPGVTV